MLKIKNNDIYLTRGETCAIDFKVWNTDGTPFVLPPVKQKSLLNLIRDGRQQRLEFYHPIPVADMIALCFANDSTVTIVIDDVAKEYSPHAGIVTLYTGSLISAIDQRSNKLVYIQTAFDDTENGVDINTAMVSVLAFTVRSGNSGKIVLQKYLNLSSATWWDGNIDLIPFGWNKFTSQEPVEIASDDVLITKYYTKQIVIGHKGNEYLHVIQDETGKIVVPYEFGASIVVQSEDTADLLENEYVYDIAIYQGVAKNYTVFEEDDNNFPIKKIFYKKQVVEPHKFVLGDSNNA